MNKYSFADKISVIDHEIKKRSHKWHLKAVSWIDYDDVSQILRFHIFKKWHLWNQKRPLEPWLNKIITHQLSNLLRNHYSNFIRPCLSCAANQGGDLCHLYGKQDHSCPLYARWANSKKKQAFNVKLPLTIEHHKKEMQELPDNFLDIERFFDLLNAKLLTHLKPIEWTIYKGIYIDNKSEEQVAIELGYKTTERNRIAGYKRIKQLKNVIIKKVKQILQKEDFYFG